MPMYTFALVNNPGEYTELFFHMDDAPRIGDLIYYADEELRRVVDRVQVSTPSTVHFPSQQFTPWQETHAPRLDEHGMPAFQSRKEVEEFVSKRNDTHPTEHIEYDQL